MTTDTFPLKQFDAAPSVTQKIMAMWVPDNKHCYVLQDTAASNITVNNQASTPADLNEALQSVNRGDVDTLSRIAVRSYCLKPQMQNIAASVLFDFLQLTGDPSRTHLVNTTPLLERIPAKRKNLVRVSPRLRMSREDALKRPLLTPSGAYLAWMSMQTDDASE